MVIRILDIVTGADTSEQGVAVCSWLRAAMSTDDTAVVSFAGVNTATSSFVASAFIPLLADYSLAEVKRRLRVINSTRQINEMIKTRMEREGLVAA